MLVWVSLTGFARAGGSVRKVDQCASSPTKITLPTIYNIEYCQVIVAHSHGKMVISR